MSGASDTPTDDAVEETLLRVVSHLLWQIRSGRRTNLSPPVLRVLTRLLREGPMPMAAVADVMDVSRPSATTIVDRMEDEGLVRRERDLNDGRQINVRLTAEGDKVGSEAHQEALERASTILARLDSDQIDLVRRALQLLDETLRHPVPVGLGEER